MARFMAPVPMNFGRESLGSPVHDTLVLKLRDDKELCASPFVLSCNSPVIAYLTVDLMQTSIDVDDFSEDAVKCFIDAAYSGTLELLTKDNFRDLNKMVHVFDVKWMMEGCRDFFGEIVETLAGTLETIDVTSYVIDEALYVQKTRKDDWFINLVIDKINKVFNEEEKSSLLSEKYAERMGMLEAYELDFIHIITCTNSVIISKFILAHLPNLREGLDANTIHILELMNKNKDSSTFSESVDDMFQRLLEVEGLTAEDQKFIILLQQERFYSLKEHHTGLTNALKISHADEITALKDKHSHKVSTALKLSNSCKNRSNSPKHTDYCWCCVKYRVELHKLK